MRKRQHGFSLIEILLVLAIIGVLAGIGIPSYMGQRQRARVIGQAQTDANVIAMQLETLRADAGVYNSADATLTPGTTFLPAFKSSGSMTYTVKITNSGMAYLITATDPSLTTSSKTILTQNHMGTVTKKAPFPTNP